MIDDGYEGEHNGLQQCTSTLDFILEGLSQTLGIAQPQAAGLLANNSRYLIHMCQKGMKGRKYGKIIAWFKVTLLSAGKLVSLLEQECRDERSVINVMNVIKTGLLSEEPHVTNLSARCIVKINNLLSERAT
jgi:hypothetical protein